MTIFNLNLCLYTGILQITLQNSVYQETLDFTNAEHHQFTQMITHAHLFEMGIEIDDFERRFDFKRTDEGNWWTEVHLQPNGKRRSFKCS